MRKDEDGYDTDEGARPSSLIAVHKLSTPDWLYDMQLLRDLEIINERTRRELGPPPKSVQATPKRRPATPHVSQPVAALFAAADHGFQEKDTMKLQHLAMTAALGVAALAATDVQGTDDSSRSKGVSAAPSAKLPPRFSAYASSVVEGDGTCVVGEASDEDGMNGRPYVYMTKAQGGHARWVTELAIPKNYYQGRATHCLLKGKSLYVLLQVDTQPQQTLSQTVLSIVKLRLGDGVVEGEVRVSVPRTEEAYTAWVWEDDGLRQVSDGVEVIGKYRYMDSEEDLPFSVVLKL